MFSVASAAFYMFSVNQLQWERDLVGTVFDRASRFSCEHQRDSDVGSAVRFTAGWQLSELHFNPF